MTVPGYISADLIYVPTENLRKSYIRVLKEFCGVENCSCRRILVIKNTVSEVRGHDIIL